MSTTLPRRSSREYMYQTDTELSTASTNSPSNSRESLLDDAEVNSDDEETSYQRIMTDFPVGVYVWKLEDLGDPLSFRLKFANRVAAQFTNLPNERVIGKRIVEGFGPTAEVSAKAFLQVALSGTETDLGEVYWEHQGNKGTYHMKAFPLPDMCVGVIFEHLTNSEGAQLVNDQMQKETLERVTELLDKVIDVMIGHGSDEGWMNQMIQNMFSYIEAQKKDVKYSAQLIDSADIASLIQNLAKPTADSEYVEQFLLTFRYFMTPRSLLSKLILRFVVATNPETKMTYKERNMAKSRIIEFLQQWIKSHFYDFENDTETLKTLQNFVDTTIFAHSESSTVRINQLIDEQFTHSEIKETSIEAAVAKNKGIAKSITLLDISPSELAHQMTLITFEKLKAIRPVEFYRQSWSKDNKNENSPNIVALIGNCNRYSRWIATEIVNCSLLKKRVQVLQHFIHVAWEFYNYQDFENMFLVVMALSQHAINRLTMTWKSIDDPTSKMWAKLSEFCSFLNNFGKYRAHIKKIFAAPAQVNVIPYVGLVLKDLTFVEDGNQSITETGTVNFDKMRMVAKFIGQIQLAQKSKFEFKRSIPVLAYLLHGINTLDEDTLYKKSKDIEAGSANSPLSSSDGSKTVRRKSLTLSLSGESKPHLAPPETTYTTHNEIVHKNPIFGKKLPKKVVKRVNSLHNLSTEYSDYFSRVYPAKDKEQNPLKISAVTTT